MPVTRHSWQAISLSPMMEQRTRRRRWSYYNLGLAYEIPARKLLADYNNNFNGKTETPESKLALENVNQMIDRTIDALARAVALAGNDPKFKEVKGDAMG